MFLFILAILLMIFVTCSLTTASEGDGIIEPGKNKEIVEILNMFDRFQPAKNVTVPPLDDMTHLIRQ